MSYQNRPRAFNNTTNMLKVDCENAFLIIVLNSGSARLLGNRAIRSIIHKYILFQIECAVKSKNDTDNISIDKEIFKVYSMKNSLLKFISKLNLIILN